MNEQKKRLPIILNRLKITYKYKHIGAYEIFFCRHGEITFSISVHKESVTMSKYLGAYSIDQQNRILCLGKRAKAEGYDFEIINDNEERHIEMTCSYTDSWHLFFSVCRFLYIISGKSSYSKGMTFRKMYVAEIPTDYDKERKNNEYTCIN